jgi:hypothetical protein
VSVVGVAAAPTPSSEHEGKGASGANGAQGDVPAVGDGGGGVAETASAAGPVSAVEATQLPIAERDSSKESVSTDASGLSELRRSMHLWRWLNLSVAPVESAAQVGAVTCPVRSRVRASRRGKPFPLRSVCR